jgi:hypothetical protein
MIAAFIYLLCGVTSLVCMVLLTQAYRRTRSRLIFWTALCFVGLAINNVLVFLDMVVFPTQIDLQIPRLVASLVGTGLLVFGFVWDADE